MANLSPTLPGPDVLAAYLAGAVAVYIVVRWLQRPLLWLATGLYRLVLGGAVLWALDALARPIGLHVALNPASAVVVGLLGVPGLAVLLVLGAVA
ncbi:MAG TPA: pro-sigmaK processing inhibitor BofA family protein [Bacillota bacterium]|nr:pro-sigmaK processing inhibitor BofA family protein [Bacillota bacterium]